MGCLLSTDDTGIWVGLGSDRDLILQEGVNRLPDEFYSGTRFGTVYFGL
jgi:hypothetical protein